MNTAEKRVVVASSASMLALLDHCCQPDDCIEFGGCVSLPASVPGAAFDPPIDSSEPHL
jgi:hypothetical protein